MAHRRTLLVRVGAVVLGVAALWAAWIGLSRSQVFEIETVEVIGTSTLDPQDVRDRAALDERATLLRVDGDAMVARLLGDPWIADATVRRKPPSTLVIEVEERVPAAVVDTGVTFWFVDDEGRVLSESVPSSATVMPVIRDVPDFEAEPGSVSTSSTLSNALRVITGIDEDLRASVRTVSAPSVSETALLTAGGVEIMIGEATHLEEKSALVADILAEQGDRVVFIDVRSIERPISRGLGE